MKEFITQAEAAVDEAEGEEPGLVTFKCTKKDTKGNVIDERTMTAHHPGDGQLGALMATTATWSDNSEKVAGTLNFFVSVLDDDDHTYIVNRLFDRRDKFGIAEVTEILAHLIEEWTGRPTVELSGSTPSRSPAGRKSTRRTPALTS